MDTLITNNTASPQKRAAGQTTLDGVSVNKRLKNELMSLMMSGCPGISAFPDGDNLLQWIGTIVGPAGTVYDSLAYKLQMKFPSNYPMSAPTITFETPIFHPNVDLDHGTICLDILKENWSAVYNVQTILLSLQSLLGEPNNDSPLNGAAARLWHNPEAFKSEVLKVYRHPDA